MMLTFCLSWRPAHIPVCDFLPKTCRRGKPRSWPSLPERRAETERRRASWKKVPLEGSPGSRQKSTVFPEIPGGSAQAVATQIHARRARCTEGEEGNAALVLSLSDGLSQSPASELPPSLACLFYLFHSWSISLSPSPSRLFAHSLLPSSLSLSKCGNFIPRRKRGGGREPWPLFFSLPKLPSPQMILVSPSFPISLFTPHTHTYTLSIH